MRSASAAAAAVVTAAATATIVPVVVHAGRAGEQTARLVALRREKGIDREIEVREDLARVLLPADTAVRAVAPRQTYVIRGHEQLNIALQPDNGELSQSDEQLVAIIAEHQIIPAKARADRTGHLMQRTAAAVAARFRRNYARIQHNRVNDLNDRRRLVAVRPQLYIAPVLYILRGEDARAALAAKQHNALVEYRQAIHDARTTDYAADLALDTIEKADVNGIKTAVKLYPLNIDRYAEQLGFPCFNRSNAARIDELLCVAGQIHANIAQALLAAAGVVDFLGVDTDRLAETARIAVIAADRTRAANFFSHVYYLQTEIEALHYQSIQR